MKVILNVEMAMGQNPVLPVNIPISTKIDYNGWCTYPKMVPLVLSHGQMSMPAVLFCSQRHSFALCSDCEKSACCRMSCLMLRPGSPPSEAPSGKRSQGAVEFQSSP